MSTYPESYMYDPNPPVAGTSWAAVFALIIAVIAIIIVIFVVYVLTTDTRLVTNRTSQWAVTAGSTAAAQTFVANPNSIFVVPANAATGYTITIQGYADLATFVTATETTVFRIDNSQNSNSVTVAGQTVAPAGQANPATVPARSVYEYHWVNSSTIKLIGWSVPS